MHFTAKHKTDILFCPGFFCTVYSIRHESKVGVPYLSNVPEQSEPRPPSSSLRLRPHPFLFNFQSLKSQPDYKFTQFRRCCKLKECPEEEFAVLSRCVLCSGRVGNF